METAIIRLVGLAIALTIAFLVKKDAKSRGMNDIAWSAGVFLLLIIFLPLYFIKRKPKLDSLSEEEREALLEKMEAGERVKSPEHEAYSTSFQLPDKYKLFPHIIVAVLWSLFSIWVCAKEGEFLGMIFLIFLGFLPYLLEILFSKFSGNTKVY